MTLGPGASRKQRPPHTRLLPRREQRLRSGWSAAARGSTAPHRDAPPPGTVRRGGPRAGAAWCQIQPKSDRKPRRGLLRPVPPRCHPHPTAGARPCSQHCSLTPGDAELEDNELKDAEPGNAEQQSIPPNAGTVQSCVAMRWGQDGTVQ